MTDAGSVVVQPRTPFVKDLPILSMAMPTAIRKIVDLDMIGIRLQERLFQILYSLFGRDPAREAIIQRIYQKVIADIIYFMNNDPVTTAELLKYLPERTGLDDVLSLLSPQQFESMRECCFEHAAQLYLLIRPQVGEWFQGRAIHCIRVGNDSVIVDIYDNIAS